VECPVVVSIPCGIARQNCTPQARERLFEIIEENENPSAKTMGQGPQM
jgi:hypothetical protein